MSDTPIPNNVPPSGDTADEAMQKSFRKGNINFDFLQPIDKSIQEIALGQERRSTRREGKRGLFNRGRMIRPVGRPLKLLWLAILLGSGFGLGSIFFLGKTILLLLLFPFLVSVFLWSLIMILLFQARPR